MEKGKILEIVIEDMSSEGQGIGKHEGMVIFVPGCVVGDRVEVSLTKVKKNYAFSKLIRITEPSPYRNEGFDCGSYDEGCGGCPLALLDYDTQLDIKEEQVRQKLIRIAGIEDPALMPIIGMEDEDNDGAGCTRYRNKAQFPVSTGGIITRKGGIVENLGDPAVGFYRAKSHEVVDCDDCWLQAPAAMAAADALRRFMEEDNITAWDPKWEKGLIRHLIVKTGFSTGEVMVIIVINGKGIPGVQKLVEMLDDAVYESGSELRSVVLNVKKPHEKKKNRKHTNIPGGSGEIMGDENIVIAGSPVIKDYIGDLLFEISPGSFYQVNPVQTVRLYDKVREYCRRGREDEGRLPVILDLYCGVGTIGLYCADMTEKIVGIEIVKEAVLDANRNAVVNGIVNARYICGQAEEVLPEYIAFAEGRGKEDSGIEKQLADDIKNAGIAIIDPPRAGCRPELIEALVHAEIERIVYVSCDPATMARDIKTFMEEGYGFVEATPVDMFPLTGSCETVALLSKLDVDKHIDVEIKLDELDLTSAESKATYAQIKEYVLEKFGLKVSTLYIAQIKKKCGIEMREHYNKSKKDNQAIPQCTPEKEEAIMDALRHFKMI